MSFGLRADQLLPLMQAAGQLEIVLGVGCKDQIMQQADLIKQKWASLVCVVGP